MSRSSRDDDDVALSSFRIGRCPHISVFLLAESHVGEVPDLAVSTADISINQKYFVGNRCKDNGVRHSPPDLANAHDSDLGIVL
ncbi:unnamed protein product [Clonostachys rhizophaga]|uniref:Uncharacterized protein n=1 Tax=Clonostachys rhizophaga TaxID=160324 RepID=A0A9N9W3R5_9HYPO|nr:unnamed protein product [Clonostachys rhizophaga]